jgi:hypothetical protein
LGIADRQASTLAQVLNSRLVVIQSTTRSLSEVRDAASTRGTPPSIGLEEEEKKKTRRASFPRL